MKQMQIALVAVQRDDDYVMHLRQGPKGRGAVGLTGFFGGRVEPYEPPIEAAAREFSEETTLEIKTDQLKRLGRVEVKSDFNHQPISITAEVFKLDLSSSTDVGINPDGHPAEAEDKLVIVNDSQAREMINNSQLTPATTAVFKELLWR